MKKRKSEETAKKRIMIVHWSQDEAIAAGLMLRHKFNVYVATNGTDALKMIRPTARKKAPFDMVLVSEEVDRLQSGLAYLLMFTASLYKMPAAVIHINLNSRFITILDFAMKIANLDIPCYKPHQIKRMFECGAHYDWRLIVKIFLRHLIEVDKGVKQQMKGKF